MDELGQVNLTHHGGHHVAVFQVEIVIGAVKVRGHHGKVIGAVLQVVAFAELDAGYLAERVWLVGIFQFGCEEHVFGHGLRRILGIDAA